MKRLVRFKKELRPPRQLCRSLGVRLQSGRQRPGEQGGQKHHQERNGVPAVIGLQGKSRNGKKEVEGQYADNGCNEAADRALRGYRNQHDAQNVERDNIGFRKAPVIKQKADQCGKDQDQRTFQKIQNGYRRYVHDLPPLCRKLTVQSIIGNDVDIQLRRKLDQPLGQRCLMEPWPAGDPAAAQHNFCDPRQAGKLRDLIRHIIAVNRFDGGPQLLCQMDIGLEPLFIGLRFHEQSRKSALKGAGHPCRGTNDLFVGGRRGKAHQDMLPRPVFRPIVDFMGIERRPVGAAAQAGFPERAQLRQRAVGKQPALGLLQQSLLQPLGLNVHKFHLLRLIKHMVGNPSRFRRSQDGKNRILDAFDMLDIQCRIDIHARFQQLLDILVSLPVPGCIPVQVCQVIDQDQLRQSFQAGIQVHFILCLPAMRHGLAGQCLKLPGKFSGLRPQVTGKQSNYHIGPCLSGLFRRFQHGIALPGPGKITGKNRQFPLFFAADLLRQGNGIHETPSFQAGAL